MTDQTIQLDIDEISCASCVETARRALLESPLVTDASISVQTGRAIIHGTIDPTEAARLVTASGYPATPVGEDPTSAAELHEHMEHLAAKKERQWRRRATIGLGMWIPMAILHWGGDSMGISGPWMPWVLGLAATAVVAMVGPGFFVSAWSALKHGGTNMDTLISIGSLTAWGYSVVLFVLERVGVEHGEPSYFTEAAALLGLISLGHWLEARSSAKAGSAIRDLLELQPETAEQLADDGTTIDVPVGSVQPGMRLLVRPGGRIPVDGTVVDGESEVDEALITGEPIPVLRRVGDPVVSGSTNAVGRLVIVADVAGNDSTIARIARLVSDTLGSRASIQLCSKPLFLGLPVREMFALEIQPEFAPGDDSFFVCFDQIPQFRHVGVRVESVDSLEIVPGVCALEFFYSGGVHADGDQNFFALRIKALAKSKSLFDIL